MIDFADQSRERLYIGGRWVEPTTSDVIDVINPTTEEPIGHVPLGAPGDIDKAVAFAQDALAEWMDMPAITRARYCDQIATGISSRREELGQLVTLELGMPLAQTLPIQVDRPAATFASMANLIAEIAWEERIGNSLVVREPIGVIGAITPWNFPLHQIAAKVAPALAAGCTVVLKPSELTPLSAFTLAEIIDDVGLPPGVFNLVSGTGMSAGEALAGHDGIAMVTFTGSTRTGRRVAELAAATVKPTALELGGKSANIILRGADIEQAVKDGLARCFMNSGQTCSALTRMVVPYDRLVEVEAVAVRAVANFAVGDPFDDETGLGPVVSESQRGRVREYIDIGLEEGARLLVGGTDPPLGLPRGYFVQPTIFSHVANDMRIASEEIFGPVLSIIPYDDEDDAIRIANDNPFGLSGGVWAGNNAEAERVARKLRTGQVAINGAPFNLMAPFGGYKQSGHGRELGRFGLEEFLSSKALQLPVS